MSHKQFWIKKIIGFAVCFVAIAAALTWVVMSLWNGILVEVLSVKTITFWQAGGILVLSKILFGGFKGKGGGPGGHWNKEMRSKWKTMTPEEKDAFREEWRNKCRTWGRWRDNRDNTPNQP